MLTMRAAALVVLVTFCATPVLAQNGTVSGVVIDDRTERPIKGVLVYVEGQQTLVETDADGRFSMMAPLGPQTITASVIGYALLTTDIELTAAPIDMTIRLSEGAGAYKESVTVSGSLRSESDSVPGSTSLHGRELENLRGAVQIALERLPLARLHVAVDAAGTAPAHAQAREPDPILRVDTIPEPALSPHEPMYFLFGGRGSAYSALLGIIVIQAISNGLTLLNLSSSLRYMITGGVLAIAVIVDSLARRSRAAHG